MPRLKRAEFADLAGDTTWKCERCGKDVVVGFGGQKNMDNHMGVGSMFEKSECAKEGRRRKAAPASASLLAKWTSKVFSSSTKTREKESKQEASASLPLQRRSTSTSVNTTTKPLTPATVHAKKPSAPKPSVKEPLPAIEQTTHNTPPFLARLASLVQNIPSSVPEGHPDDEFYEEFKTYPINLPKVDAWETLDRTLNHAVGYNKSAREVSERIRRGPHGIISLFDFIEKAMVIHGIGETLLEGKVNKLCEALELLYPSANTAASAPHIPAPTSVPEESAISSTPLATKDKQKSTSSRQETWKIPNDPAFFTPIPTLLLPDLIDLTESESVPSLRPINAASVPCHGLEIVLPSHCFGYTPYPIGIHDREPDLPWEPNFYRGKIYVQSLQCEREGMGNHPCRPCRNLRYHDRCNTVMTRMETGCAPNTNYAYLGTDEKDNMLRDRLQQLDNMRLDGLNTSRTIARSQQKLDDLQRLVVAVGSADVPRVNMIVRVALRRGCSPKAILEKLILAAEAHARGLSLTKSFTDSERDVAAIIFRMGGQRLLDVARKALHLPSVTTTRRALTRPALKHSQHYDSATEDVVANINGLSGDETIFPPKTPIVIMVDEIKLDELLGYDEKTNTIIGTCREHSEGYSMEFSSEDTLLLIHDGIRKGRVHLSREATVAALNGNSRDSSVNASKIIFGSGTCKGELAEQQYRICKALLDGCIQTRIKLGGRVHTLASDGDAVRGKALVRLTMKHHLSSHSPIYPILKPLSLMNLQCGDDDVTSDKDYKHLGKRIRTANFRDIGIGIAGVPLPKGITERHLIDAGNSATAVAAALDATDKQDVVLTYKLLAMIALLKPVAVEDETNLLYAKTRKALVVLGLFCRSFLQIYTSVELSLREQLIKLSFVAHFLILFYQKEKTKFIPTQLYNDIQITVKNSYFSVAKTKIDNPDGEYWIIQQGTDGLEDDFGNVRTCVGNNSNVTMKELCNRLQSANDCTEILARHAVWNRGSRRKTYPSLDFSDTEITAKYDHVNAASWIGDVHVRDVNLHTCWAKGRMLVEDNELIAWFIPDARDEFQAMDALKDTHDMLKPFGALLMYTNEDPTLDTESSSASNTSNEAPNSENGQRGVVGDDVGEGTEEHVGGKEQDDLSLEPSIDELAETVLSEADQTAQDGSKLGAAWLSVHGRKIHKATLCRNASADFHTPLSTDRLKRVRAGQKYNPTASVATAVDLDNEECLQVDDPAVTLAACNGQLFLAVIRISNFKTASGEKPPFIQLSTADRITTIMSGQILLLKPRNPTDSNSCDWTTLAKLDFDRTLTALSLLLVLPIRPTVGQDESNSSVWQFTTQELLAYSRLLLEKSRSAPAALVPHITKSDNFPYSISGQYCFSCEPDTEELHQQVSHNSCHLCPSLDTLHLATGNNRVLHMSMHMLCDRNAPKHSAQPCAFCLRTNNARCRLFFYRPNGKDQLCLDKIQCPLKVKFTMGHASRSSSHNPTTNHPIRCPLPNCPDVVWRYNLEAHLRETHGLINDELLEPFIDKWFIKADEREDLSTMWRKNLNRKGKQKKIVRKQPPMKLSIEHSSRALFRSSQSAASTSNKNAGSVPKPREEEAAGVDEFGKADSSDNDDDEGPRAPTTTSRRFTLSVPDSDSDEGITTQRSNLGISNIGIVTPCQTGSAGIAIETSSSNSPATGSLEYVLARDDTDILMPAAASTSTAATSHDGLGDEEAPPLFEGRRSSKRNRPSLWGSSGPSNDCTCGETISKADISDGVGLFECSEIGCETRWFHYKCHNFTRRPANWRCSSCHAAKKSR